MNYRILGSSGLRVSELCLGAMSFAGNIPGLNMTREDAETVIDLYRDAGGNFIDTANIYAQGASESMVGDIIKPYRSKIVLATKYAMSMDVNDPNASGMHRKNLVQSVEQSLKRLNTDYIDLYWIHAWDDFTNTDEVLRALDDLVRAGKILHIGASNTSAWRVTEATVKANLRAQSPITAVQAQYSLVERTLEADMLPMTEALGMSVVAWSPLGGGILTGKYHDDNVKGRLNTTAFGEGLLNQRNSEISRLVMDIANEQQVTPVQLSLAWLLRKKIIPIIGGSKVSHFKEAIEAVNVHLSDKSLARLEEATAPPPIQPSCLFPRINRMIYGETLERIKK